MTFTPSYLSQTSANALISDLRPTSISPIALNYINIVLDELLVSLLSAAQSINPKDLRLVAIPEVFSGEKGSSESTGLRALGRSAVGEAEVELRSWYEGHPAGRGFGGDGKGNGMVRGEFALQQAAELLRIKGATFCTLAAEEPPAKNIEDRASSDWRKAGGDISLETIEPAGLWITAIIEHVCEHILSQMSRVVARDSSITEAGPADLYTALCEDESIWGIFKKMQVRHTLEEASKSRTQPKRAIAHISPPTESQTQGRASPITGSPHGSKVSLPVRESSLDSPSRSKNVQSAFDERTSVEAHRLGPVAFGGMKKSPSLTSRFLGKDRGVERSGSMMSMSTSTSHDSIAARAKSPGVEEDEFDALIRSGETVKVSLTPSRLRTFEAGKKSQNGSPTSAARPNRAQVLPPIAAEHSPLRDYGPAATEAARRGSPAMNRSRSSSFARLKARGASTIEEQEDEDDEELPGNRRGKRETLTELLAKEPANYDTKDLPRRQVPAVVLGAPPPPAPTHLSPQLDDAAIRRQPSAPSLNRPGGRVVSGDEPPIRRSKLTEAQEMAEFLRSTAPPPNTIAAEESSKQKGLKGFMSKISGSTAKKERERARQPLEDIPTIDPALVARRKQSLNSVSSIPVPPNRYMEEAPPVPTKTPKLRKRSDEEREGPPILAPAIGAGVMAAAAEAGYKRSVEHGQESVGSTIMAGDYHDQRSEETHRTNGRYNAQASPQEESIDSVPEAAGLREEDHTANQQQIPDTDIRALAAPSAPPSTFLASPSDANSFMTAQEGYSPQDTSPRQDSRKNSQSVTEDVEISEKEVGSLQSPAPVETTPKGSPTRSHAPHLESGPSIPLADLTPLRSLLNHASTVRECQLLLDAVLSQWGVPLHPSSPDSHLSPEDRIAAWLLAGREGPVMSPSATSQLSSPSDNNEILRTPTQPLSAAFESSSGGYPLSSQAKGIPRSAVESKEEILSDATSMTDAEDGELMQGHIQKVGNSNIMGKYTTPGVVEMPNGKGTGVVEAGE